MSHFSVLLIVPDALSTDPEKIVERIEQDMAPFMENCCSEPEKRFMEFFDVEDEYREQYDKGTREMIVMPDGRLLLPWDDEFKVKPKEGEFPFPRPEPPKELERRQVPFKETFSTFEEFVAEWHGRGERDDTYNRYGYWQNPNAKWDWYEVGGRWAGFFQLKPGRQGALGKQYGYGQLDISNGGVADICFKNAIDFDRMRDEAEEKAAELYDAVQEAIKDTPEPVLWEIIRDELSPDLEAARKKYHAQPRVKAFSEFSRTDFGSSRIGFFGNVEDFDIPREQYLANARDHVGVPFAVVKDGEWYEKGKMGWWGIAHGEKDQETWNSIVNKMLDELPGETLLVAIDCHI